MSEDVVLYQLSILVTVVTAGIVIGRRAMIGVAVCWMLWTVVMVFTRWLFLFQFLTATLALYLGSRLRNSGQFLVYQRMARAALKWTVTLAVIGVGVALYFDSKHEDRASGPPPDTPQVAPQAFQYPIPNQAESATMIPATPRTATSNLYAIPSGARKAPNKRDQVKPCEYKAVMSDDDYRACGLRVPGK